jgi:regulator of nonsense transcripts 1
MNRMVELGMPQVMIRKQYRMHPALSEFSSKAFYQNQIQNGIQATDRTPTQLAFEWPKQDLPLIFIDYKWKSKHEKKDKNGKSIRNIGEAKIVNAIVNTLILNGISTSQIGIITPYAAQRTLISKIIQEDPMMKEIQISSIDSFQGAEKDYIIISCDRDNNRGNIGFVNDERRLNVSITRAKYGLFIIVNIICLSKCEIWRKLIDFYKSKEVLIPWDLEKYLKK